MGREVAWRLMFRVDDQVKADRCLGQALILIAALRPKVTHEPKPYWKIAGLWEVSLRGEMRSPAGEGILLLLQAAEKLATGWQVSGLSTEENEVTAFEGVFNASNGRAHARGLDWASFSVGLSSGATP